MDVTVDEVALDGVSLLGGKLGSVLLYSKRQGRLLVDVLVVLIFRESLPEVQLYGCSGAVIAHADAVCVVVVLATAGVADIHWVFVRMGDEPPHVRVQSESGCIADNQVRLFLLVDC